MSERQVDGSTAEGGLRAAAGLVQLSNSQNAGWVRARVRGCARACVCVRGFAAGGGCALILAGRREYEALHSTVGEVRRAAVADGTA